MLYRTFRGLAALAAMLMVLGVFTLVPSTPTAAQTAGQRYYPPRNPFFNKTALQIADGGMELSFAYPNVPTSVQFGPDDRLYVATHKGLIYAYTIARNNGTSTYYITATETISLINTIPNHNDDGTPNPAVMQRQVTGIYLTGSYEQPILYVTSSDVRSTNDAGDEFTLGDDTNLDTNSGIISRLTRNAENNGWNMVHLVRGLPKSEEFHSINGMVIDPDANKLYVMSGGNTNMGSPGRNFAYTPEYALSSALLSVDLATLGSKPVLTDTYGHQYIYDLPTLDDPTRGIPGQPDPGDPFGGNDGLNQAVIVPNGIVQIYSPGYRNGYDVVLTENTRRLYTFDNGPNNGWGNTVVGEGPDGNCTNQPGTSGLPTYWDQLHYITGPGYYGGHPVPVRGNPDGVGLFKYDRVNNQEEEVAQYPFTADWSPVPFDMADPRQCDFLTSGNSSVAAQDGSLLKINKSTNGLAEYTASNFGDVMKGNLLAASYDGKIWRIVLNAAGDAVVSSDNTLMSGFGTNPLDLTAQGDLDVYPGTIWAVNYGPPGKVTIFEPDDFFECTAANVFELDEDLDGYSNADEITAGSNPCSNGSRPHDWDQDFASDVTDPDDDNDGIPDLTDAFAIDPLNGTDVNVPFNYPFSVGFPGSGFFTLGFTGLMTNGSTDYLNMFDDNNLTAGGAAGAFTIDEVSSGDALGSMNTQQNAFQFGINANTSTPPFIVESRMVGPFFNNGTAVSGQSQGVYIGTGDQDNYLKIALELGGIRVIREEGGTVNSNQLFDTSLTGPMLNAGFLDLSFTVNPQTRKAQPRIRVSSGIWQTLGAPLDVPAAWLNPNDSKGLALGLIATSGSSGMPFAATWDYFRGDAAPLEPPSTPSATATETPAALTATPGTPASTATPNATGTVATSSETPISSTVTATATATTAAPTATPTENPGTNLLVNGSFEDPDGNKLAEPWVVKLATQDKLKCNKDTNGDGIFEKTFAHEGLCAFAFKGSPAERAKVEQKVDLTGISFAAGDTLTISSFVNASKSTAAGKIKVTIKYADGTAKSKIDLSLAQTNGYEPFTESVDLTSSSVEKIKVSVNHRSPDGKLYVDAMRLTYLNSGSTMIPLPEVSNP